LKRGLPLAYRGQRIGLLGGSFDPPHAGHVHITRQALGRFGLDHVWWIVSPGNPLKTDPVADFAARMQACRKIMRHPRVTVSDIEARLHSSFTAETLARMLALYPGVRFVWLMGADNLTEFHRWRDWRGIAQSVPIGVMARSGERVQAGLSRMASVYHASRIDPAQAGALPSHRAPAWCLLGGATVDISSTDIRNKGRLRH